VATKSGGVTSETNQGISFGLGGGLRRFVVTSLVLDLLKYDFADKGRKRNQKVSKDQVCEELYKATLQDQLTGRLIRYGSQPRIQLYGAIVSQT
jgi:hypothetical protein